MTTWRAVLDGAARVAMVEGDCLDALRAMPEASVDSVVTDPPYGLGTRDPTVDEIVAYLRGDALDTGGDFMGREWQVPSVAIWREVWRVCKPGAHVLCFAGTRTLDLIALGLRAAGFEFRDTISNEGVLRWVHGQGFPKGIAVGKAIDRVAGLERQVVGPNAWSERGGLVQGSTYGTPSRPDATAPATDAARRWEGWNVALKPAWEPILCFRKPLDGTVAANVLRHGTGALNIDGCRVGAAGGGTRCDRRDADGNCLGHDNAGHSTAGATVHARESRPRGGGASGRWPSNCVLSHEPGCRRVGTKQVRIYWGSGRSDVVAGGAVFKSPKAQGPLHADADGMEEVEAWRCVEGCAVRALDAQAGERTSGAVVTRRSTVAGYQGAVYGAESRGPEPVEWYGDTGPVSRFFPCFYAAKASGDDERWFYCRVCKLAGPKSLAARHAAHKADVVWHPTVKSVELMRWLVRLVTPKDGLVLDPFAGTGSTGIACRDAGFRFVGIEREPDYAAIARGRLDLGPRDGQQSLFAGAGTEREP